MKVEFNFGHVVLSFLISWCAGAVAFYLHPSIAAAGAGIILALLLLYYWMLLNVGG